MKKMSFFETFLVPKLNFLCHKMSSSQISKRCRFLSPHIIVLLFFNKLKDVLKLKVPFPKQKNRAHLSYPFEVLKKVQTKLLILILKSWREASDSNLKFSLDQSVTFFKYRGLFLWKKVTILKKIPIIIIAFQKNKGTILCSKKVLSLPRSVLRLFSLSYRDTLSIFWTFFSKKEVLKTGSFQIQKGASSN